MSFISTCFIAYVNILACYLFILSVALGSIIHAQDLQQSTIKGLLIMQMPSGDHAGTASQMNATVVPARQGGFAMRFNQSVGSQMIAATNEVYKFMRLRHGDKLPAGKCIEFAFSNKHSPKDGPSAAVACALMAESILTNKPLDKGFAVTGDLTATGEVQPIGGVAAKMRGAARRECNIMAVPKKNQSAVQDIYVLEGVASIAECQVILIETFDEAWQVAQQGRSEKIKQALADYTMVQQAIQRKAANAKHPMVLEKLRSVLKAIPNHESARLIALHGMNQGPKTLSLGGSLKSIQQAAIALNNTLSNGSYLDRGTNDPLWDSVSQLQKLRSNVDPRTKNYISAFLDAAEFVKSNRVRKKWSSEMEREFRNLVGQIQIEEKKLVNDSAIQEELMSQ